MTAGPWRPVSLEVSYAHIEDVSVNYSLSDSLTTATGGIHARINGAVDEVRYTISFAGEERFSETSKESDADFVLGSSSPRIVGCHVPWLACLLT